MIIKSKFVMKTAAVAAALVCAGAANATGQFSQGPITPGNGAFTQASPKLYATEAIGTTTAVTVPNLTYRMGVNRSAAQNFVLIYRLPTGVFFSTTPNPPVFMRFAPAGEDPGSIAGAPTVTLKRGGAGSNEVAFTVTPGANGATTAVVGPPAVPSVATASVATGSTFELTTGTLTSTLLSGNGATLPATITVLEDGETACVDNSGTPSGPGACTLSAPLAQLAQASNFVVSIGGAVGVLTDAGNTTTNVGATVPLAGFVPSTGSTFSNADDSATIARAKLVIKNQTLTAAGPPAVAGIFRADGLTEYQLTSADKVTVTISDTGNFVGLAPSGLYLQPVTQLNVGNTTTPTATQIFAPSGANYSLTLDGDVATGEFILSYKADGTTPLGTGRTLGVAGIVDPAVAGPANLPFAGNTGFWNWRTNGTILETPFFTTAPGQVSVFAFTNRGAAADYQAQCLAETGNGITYGTAQNGTLAANGQTVIVASDICTFAGTNKRAGIRFTIAGSVTNLKGVLRVNNQSTANLTLIELIAPN